MKLAALFTDDMVLQRDQVLPVWGRGTAGETITVEFSGQRKTTTVAADGKWLLNLDPLSANAQGQLLQVKPAGGSSILLRNVVVGDVWLCSGQSNMEWPVSASANPETEIAAANHPLIRHFTVPNRLSYETEAEMHAVWQICSPEVVGGFSAVGYFFGRELNRALNVPIGLINSSWGGTRIEAWTSREALLTDPDCRQEVETRDRWLQSPEGQAAIADSTNFVVDQQKWVTEQGTPDPGNTGHAQGWALPDYDDSQWEEMAIPTGWQAKGHNFSGAFWFRRVIDVPAAWVGKELLLELGACDKTDTTYFNNVQVGSIGYETKSYWSAFRVYRVPAQLVKPGRNVIAVRVYSNVYQGGMIGPASSMRLSIANDATVQPLPLAGQWRYRVEYNFGLVKAVLPQRPVDANTIHILYDCKIQPLVPFAIKGVIWYQGESNAGAGMHYRKLFPLMIRDWRRTFGQANLPFLFVQIANWMAPPTVPVEPASGWPELREAQFLTLSEPQTGMAVTIDIGEAEDIHPKNKQDVGKRLALAALAKAHGQSLAYSGPLYKSHQIEGAAMRLRFDHATGGLKTRNGDPLKAFAIAGADGQFVWADARIDGETVVVKSGEVPQPVAVRYAWAVNPAANLYNAADLPASPFRTDVN